MSLDEIIKQAIAPALSMLPSLMDSAQARVMLLAIGLQESRFEHRRQIVGGLAVGPARGFWQFERGGGCRGVLEHPASRIPMREVCGWRGVQPEAGALWTALSSDDVLAAAAARLLLFTDPKALPALGDENGAWDLYLRVWRPGKPHPHTWDGLYARALEAVS